jgi:hypothetical protein
VSDDSIVAPVGTWWWPQGRLLPRWLLPSLLLSALSVRAEAPPPSQEFWNYMVEFGDAQGELFDPTDYATIANLPAQVPQEVESTVAPPAVHALPPDTPAAPVIQEQLP